MDQDVPGTAESDTVRVSGFEGSDNVTGTWNGQGVGDLATFLDRLCPDPEQRREFQKRMLADLGDGGGSRGDGLRRPMTPWWIH